MQVYVARRSFWGWLRRFLTGRRARRAAVELRWVPPAGRFAGPDGAELDRFLDADRAAVLGRPDIFVKDLADLADLMGQR